ncbi:MULTISPECIES: TAT-variant-translocated molybdopterin oxidoreductase [unclassified Aureispira]|uniref:TAT-variant-translocated molybdopterin oxidoreductase n=1 Tax=unclassified Aureispira TaxID=2649989 RepID=UPI0006985CC5|nr:MULTISPECIES: TAT-variant-translocated molybdopterin oxidoreductase [unclassified Aureispira]WMX15654.1 TAT-variant-translocated molybdopterin oxidoreductase [Aureispira sp. CCB-E]
MNKKENNNKVWVSVEDLTNDISTNDLQQNEFAHTEGTENSEHSRRDFLKYMGFGLTAATVASCETPVKTAIPYVIKPEEIVPGVATYFASAVVQGGDVLPALVKTREGRPIKIEGNPGSKKDKTFTEGGTCARSQASILELYDTNRLKGAGDVAKLLEAEKIKNTKQRNEAEAKAMLSWADLDKAVKAGLNGQIRIVSHTNNSPTFKAAVEAFKGKYPSAQLVQYDPISYSAIIEANEKMYNKPWIPAYHFDKAMCVVGIEADFLGTWVSPVEYSKDYIKNRKVTDQDIKVGADKTMSTHIQFESRMSLTGSNADHRVLIKPSEWGAAVGMLYTEVAKETGNSAAALGFTPSFAWKKAPKAIKDTAKKLVANARKALVVCGINDVNIQMTVNAINEMLGAVNATMTLTKDMHSKQRLGRDAAVQALVNDMKSGAVNAIIVCDGANPAYDIPGMAADFATALPKVGMSVSLGLTLNETAALCKYVAPDHHTLEAWGDAEPKKGEIYVVQPTIAPLFSTRQAGESLLAWAGISTTYHDFMKETWKNKMFPAQSDYMTFQSFWNNTLHNGWFKTSSPIVENIIETPVVDANTPELPTDVEPTPEPSNLGIVGAVAALSQKKSDGLEVTFYESVQLGAGQHANNPWLQEMPDPIMRTTWDNFIQIPLKWDGGSGYTSLNNLKDGDIATITIDGKPYQLPVFRTFGQMDNTVSIALGYGRTRAGKAGNGVGTDLFPAIKGFSYAGAGSVSEYEGHDGLFACVQMHHTYGLTTTDEATGKTKMHTYATGEEKPFNVDEHNEGFQGALIDRSVFFHSTAKEVAKDVKELAEKRKGYQYLNSKGLYPDRKEFYGMGHHWGMAVDLNSCTGCGACTVACMAENNVPVVGKFEVNNIHEMTWLRIDRYFYGNEETPNAVYMPMMCQHCDNAPCENVCPVAATNHSSEGLNQMTYNRCVGTRYCANNCPFKVRRFNWLDYTSADIFPSNEVDMNRGIDDAESYNYMNDNLTRMVLNPDVTVRTRGVIEKCSFCIQRIQEGKLAAKVEGRKLKDSDVTPACAQACSTGAIVFGDDNNPNSEVYKLQRTQRAYIPLEETNVRSSVNYLMKVVNKDENFA